MAAGFSAIAYVVIALFVSILFYAIVKLAHRHEVLIACTILLAFFFMFNALGNYYSRTLPVHSLNRESCSLLRDGEA